MVDSRNSKEKRYYGELMIAISEKQAVVNEKSSHLRSIQLVGLFY